MLKTIVAITLLIVVGVISPINVVSKEIKLNENGFYVEDFTDIYSMKYQYNQKLGKIITSKIKYLQVESYTHFFNLRVSITKDDETMTGIMNSNVSTYATLDLRKEKWHIDSYYIQTNDTKCYKDSKIVVYTEPHFDYVNSKIKVFNTSKIYKYDLYDKRKYGVNHFVVKSFNHNFSISLIIRNNDTYEMKEISIHNIKEYEWNDCNNIYLHTHFCSEYWHLVRYKIQLIDNNECLDYSLLSIIHKKEIGFIEIFDMVSILISILMFILIGIYKVINESHELLGTLILILKFICIYILIQING